MPTHSPSFRTPTPTPAFLSAFLSALCPATPCSPWAHFAQVGKRHVQMLNPNSLREQASEHSRTSRIDYETDVLDMAYVPQVLSPAIL